MNKSLCLKFLMSEHKENFRDTKSPKMSFGNYSDGRFVWLQGKERTT